MMLEARLRGLASEPMPDNVLRIFEGKALAEALTRFGHPTSERTVQRWKKGDTTPKPQDLRAIQELVGAELAETERTAPAPMWARGLADEVIDAIERSGGDLIERVVRQLEVQIRPLLSQGDEDPDGKSAALQDGATSTPLPKE